MILERLRDIEAEVIARPSEVDDHVGSVKFMTGMRRPGAAPRIPSFGVGVARNIKSSSAEESVPPAEHSSGDEDSDSELMEALSRLSTAGLHSTWSDAAAGMY